MKTSSEKNPPRPPDRATAVGFLMTNLLVLPGAGTFMAGRRSSGFFQAAMALVGFFLVISWLAQRVGAWLQTGAWTWGVNALLLAGIFLSVAAWVWSLGVGLRFLRQSPRTSPPPMGGGTHHE